MFKILVHNSSNIVCIGNFKLQESYIILPNDCIDYKYNKSNSIEFVINDIPRYFYPHMWSYVNGTTSINKEHEKFIYEKALKDCIDYVNKNTSNKIISGFNYTINNVEYHFSYDQFDQQNFADTANACLMLLSGTEGLPTEITWNGYLENNVLKRITLNAEEFLKLYTEGALTHKALCMEEGGRLKANIMNRTSAFELLEFMDDLDIPYEIGRENYANLLENSAS